MGRDRIIRFLLQVVVFLAPAAIGTAQTEKMIVPTDLKQQTIVTEPVTLSKGFFRLGVVVNYRVADKYFDNRKNKEYYFTSTWGTKSAYNLTFQYGITERLEAELFTDYMHNKIKSQSSEIAPGTNTSINVVSKLIGLGFGDTHLDLKYQLIPESKFKISLTAIADATIPTGQKNPTNIKSATKYDLPVGDGTYAVSGELYARTILYPYSFTAYIMYNYNFQGSKQVDVADISESRFRLGNRFETGLSVNVHLNEWIVLANELSFYHEGKGWVNRVTYVTIPESWAGEYVPNLVFQIKRFRLAESVLIPFIGRNVPADPLFVMSVQYVF